jgi:tRNA threonylcarbamoyladenosine biosynthesis protein TsaE
LTITTQSEEETIRVARDLAASLERGAVVLLYGDLGAGKTVFVRGLAEGLGADPDEVTSPTFTLIQEYRGRMPLYHVDLYRIDKPEEVEDLGLDDLGAAGVLAIEWAERLPSRPDQAIDVRIEDAGENERVVRIHSTL